MLKIVKIFIAGILLVIAVRTSPGWAYAYNINVNTASLAGTAAALAFDFIDGDGIDNNTVQISNFLTDGIFDPATGVGTGEVSGQLDSVVVIGDASGFNEFLQAITLGNSFQFQLETTNVFAAGATVPDSFSFFILDSSGFPLFATTDNTGANALFALDLTGTASGNLSVFASTSTEPDSPTWSIVPIQNVPEPDCLGLILLGGWSVYLRKKRSTKPKKQN